MSVLIAVFLTLAQVASPADYLEENGISYCRRGDLDLRLDLARPTTGDGPFPGIVFIHGGGWLIGDRSKHRDQIRECARRGYVAVTVSYRLTDPDERGIPRHAFPAQVQDVKSAVRWLRTNAERYHVDPERIGAVGGSAGGHLSLLLALTDDDDRVEGRVEKSDVSSRVQAVVNFYGPTDLQRLMVTSPDAAKLVVTLLGGRLKPSAGSLRAASPITYVSKDDPPVLTIHGSKDTLVPPEQARLLDARMKHVGAPHTLLIIDGQGHGLKGDSSARAVDASWRFLEEHLQRRVNGNQ